jgi:hypothetical protein
MEISDALKKLIDASLIDGKITTKEKEILIKKAESDGIDKDEFQLYLSSLLHEKKKQNDIGYTVDPLTGKQTQYSKSQTRKGLIIALSALIALGSFIFLMAKGEKSEKANEISPAEKYGCSSFEECISKYQFDGAYYYYSLDPNNKKQMDLVNAQVTYWSKEKNFEKAYDILQEYKIEANYNLNTGDEKDESNIAYNNQANFYNNLLDDIINKMLITDQPKEIILNYCKAFKPIVIGNEKDKSFFGLGGYNSSVLSNERYEKILVKVNENGM